MAPGLELPGRIQRVQLNLNFGETVFFFRIGLLWDRPSLKNYSLFI